jgi:hypothetical protein
LGIELLADGVGSRRPFSYFGALIMLAAIVVGIVLRNMSSQEGESLMGGEQIEKWKRIRVKGKSRYVLRRTLVSALVGGLFGLGMNFDDWLTKSDHNVFPDFSWFAVWGFISAVFFLIIADEQWKRNEQNYKDSVISNTAA